MDCSANHRAVVIFGHQVTRHAKLFCLGCQGGEFVDPKITSASKRTNKKQRVERERGRGEKRGERGEERILLAF